MGVEQLSEEEFEAELKRIKKSSLKKKILLGAAAIAGSIGISAFSTYAYVNYAIQMEERFNALAEESVIRHAKQIAEESIPRPAKEAIDKLVNETNTPEDAFNFVRDNVEFIADYDKNRFGYDYGSSLQEMYGLGKGDCEDGAIGFAALLSDNPEYNVTIAGLIKADSRHIIALYQNNGGKWNYASFSEFNVLIGMTSIMHDWSFDSIDEAVRQYSNGNYDSYCTIQFTAEQLKYGRNLLDDKEICTEKISLY